MSDVTYPLSQERISSVRLKEALAILPSMAGMRPDAKVFTHFEIRDSLQSKLWALERFHDDHADKEPNGICSFGSYFRDGVILPNGELLIGHGMYPWRMRLMEYHGGWYVTVLNGGGMRPPTFPVSPELWGNTVAGIEDTHIRSEVMSRSMKQGWQDGADYGDLLEFVHKTHRDSVLRKPDGNHHPSIVTFSI